MPDTALSRLLRPFRSLASRVCRVSGMTVLYRPLPVPPEPGAPGYTLVQLRGPEGLAQCDLAEQAMLAAGEPPGLARPRLERGDEFFGLCRDGVVGSFGWVSTHDRQVGPFRYIDAPGRVFLYNFVTLPAHRGKGLYGVLLLAMCARLVAAGQQQLMAEVNTRNLVAAKLLDTNGFVPVTGLRFCTLLGRWPVAARVGPLGVPALAPLFKEAR